MPFNNDLVTSLSRAVSRKNIASVAAQLPTVLGGLVNSLTPNTSSGSAVLAVPSNGVTSTSKLSDITLSKGVLFGGTLNNDTYPADPSQLAWMSSELDIVVAENECKGSVWGTVHNDGSLTTDWTKTDLWMQRVVALGIQNYRWHCILYPSFDMPGVNTTSVTGQTWMPLIDAIADAAFAKMKYYKDHYGMEPTSIDVTNENCDGNTNNSYKTSFAWWQAATANPFVVAGGTPFSSHYPAGASYITYLYYRCAERAAHYGIKSKLIQCHDNLESCGPRAGTYFQNNAASVLNMVTNLVANKAPIDGISLQSHLGLARPIEPFYLNVLLDQFESLASPVTNKPLIFIVSEFDTSSGTIPPTGNCLSAIEADRRYAEMARLYVDAITPRITGGEFLCWTTKDSLGWLGGAERAGIIDSLGNRKPTYYAIAYGFAETSIV